MHKIDNINEESARTAMAEYKAYAALKHSYIFAHPSPEKSAIMHTDPCIYINQETGVFVCVIKDWNTTLWVPDMIPIGVFPLDNIDYDTEFNADYIIEQAQNVYWED